MAKRVKRSRIRVEHKSLGSLFGDLLEIVGERARVQLDALEGVFTLSLRYISDANDDVRDEGVAHGHAQLVAQ